MYSRKIAFLVFFTGLAVLFAGFVLYYRVNVDLYDAKSAVKQKNVQQTNVVQMGRDVSVFSGRVDERGYRSAKAQLTMAERAVVESRPRYTRTMIGGAAVAVVGLIMLRLRKRRQDVTTSDEQVDRPQDTPPAQGEMPL